LFLSLLDGLEDLRPVSQLESAFRRLVKQHHSKLLEAKRTYWKHRNTTRWVVFADENSSLFQAMATYSMRRNFIGSLTLDDGSVISQHEQKAGALWLAYKDRLDILEFKEI
jgi:hypothetical protein